MPTGSSPLSSASVSSLTISELLISGGILGDTVFWFAERIAESELGAGVSTFGGIEVIEQMLDCPVEAGIGLRMDSHLQHFAVGMGNQICVGSEQITNQ